VIVLSHPEWWLDHVEELVDALTIAASDPERDEPVRATDAEVVIADPGWWLEDIDELEAGLAEAVREREPQREGSIDLDAWLSRALLHTDVVLLDGSRLHIVPVFTTVKRAMEAIEWSPTWGAFHLFEVSGPEVLRDLEPDEWLEIDVYTAGEFKLAPRRGAWGGFGPPYAA
jgi:hypothetical protein